MSRERLCVLLGGAVSRSEVSMDDRESVRAARSGDEEAFAALVRRHSGGLHRTVARSIGDDPEAVTYVTDLALRFRQRFGRDVVVDMLCYRKHGHNEGDEPAFTQPLMYQKIRHRPSVRGLYQAELEASRELTLGDSKRLADEFTERLYAAFKSAQDSCPMPLREEHAFGCREEGRRAFRR